MKKALHRISDLCTIAGQVEKMDLEKVKWEMSVGLWDALVSSP